MFDRVRFLVSIAYFFLVISSVNSWASTDSGEKTADPEQERSSKSAAGSMLASSPAVTAVQAADHSVGQGSESPLHIVTPVSDIQRIIIGYLGFAQSKVCQERSYTGSLHSGMAISKLHFLHDSQKYIFASAYGGFSVHRIHESPHEICGFIPADIEARQKMVCGIVNLKYGFCATESHSHIYLWDIRALRVQLITEIPLQGHCVGLIFHAQENMLMIMCLDKQKKLTWETWDVSDLENKKITRIQAWTTCDVLACYTDVSLAPNGAYLACPQSASPVLLLAMCTKKVVPNADKKDITDVMWLTDKICIVGSSDYTISFWDISNKKPIKIKEFNGYVPADYYTRRVKLGPAKNGGFADTANGSSLRVVYRLIPEKNMLISSLHSIIKVWDLSSCSCLATMSECSYATSGLSVSPNSDYLISTHCSCGSATLWELEDPLVAQLSALISNNNKAAKK